MRNVLFLVLLFFSTQNHADIDRFKSGVRKVQAYRNLTAGTISENLKSPHLYDSYKLRDLKPLNYNDSFFADHSNKKEIKFVVFGDSGTAKPAQREVAQSMFKTCRQLGCDFALSTGDLVYNVAFDESPGDTISDKDLSEVKERFSNVYAGFGKGFNILIALGNHDWGGNVQHFINYSLIDPNNQWKVPFTFYGVPKLPSWLGIYSYDSTRQRQLWDGHPELEGMYNGNLGSTKIVGHLDNGGAEQYLCSKKGWKFTFAHHFIYSARDDGKKRTVTTNIMKKSFLPLMRKCGVQIHFSGHDHDLQHIEVPKGRGFDFVQVLSGSSGKIERPGEWKIDNWPKGEYRTSLALREFGYAYVKVTPNRVSISYYASADGTAANNKLVRVMSYNLSDFN